MSRGLPLTYAVGGLISSDAYRRFSRPPTSRNPIRSSSTFLLSHMCIFSTQHMNKYIYTCIYVENAINKKKPGPASRHTGSASRVARWRGASFGLLRKGCCEGLFAKVFARVAAKAYEGVHEYKEHIYKRNNEATIQNKYICIYIYIYIYVNIRI